MRKLILSENLHWRLFVYVLGIFVSAWGVAFSVNAALGVSPINSLPYVISQMTGVYLGTCLTVLLSVFLLAQIIILRKNFKWIQLGQLFGAFLAGFFLNFVRSILGDFRIPTYFGQLLLLGIGIICLAAGITLFMSVRFVPLPFEGLVAAIAGKIPSAKFHRIMIALSFLCVMLSVLFSLLFLGGVYGVREGTLFSAVLTGRMIPIVRKALAPLLGKIGITPMV